MKDTINRILEASAKVFSKDGYTHATTKEIANASGLSEMTLFRRFESKQNLFIETIRYAIDQSIEDESAINYDCSLFDFTSNMLHRKLINISKNFDLFRMLIIEILHDRLPSEYDVVHMIKHEMDMQFEVYASKHKRSIDAHRLSQVIAGFVLHDLIVKSDIPYHQLSKLKQKDYINTLIQQIHI